MIAVYNPPLQIQMMLNKVDKQPLLPGLETMVLPKGNRTKPAILKHCKPKGIPIMVQQKTNPVTT